MCSYSIGLPESSTSPALSLASDFFAYIIMPLAAYFRNGNSASLLYSVGCHSGLNVLTDAINGGAPALYSADFPQAVLKQGGNWIGNTGYGYGDSDLIGYSERLALLFTKQLGRDVRRSPIAARVRVVQLFAEQVH